MRKVWMLGLFGGAIAFSYAAPGVSEGAVTTQIENLEIGGEIRSRFDYRSPDSFSNTTGRDPSEADDTHWLRTRLHAKLNFGNGITGKISLQDAHVSGTTAVGTDDAGVTVNEAYINIEDIFGSPLDFLVGRVQLNYGDGRLISELDWSNAARHWDGARLRYNNGDQGWVDLLYSELVNGDVNNAASALGTTTSESPDDDYDLYALWAHHNINDQVSVDAYVMLQHDGLSHRGGELITVPTSAEPPKDMDRYTSGILVKYDDGTFYGSVEYDEQMGDDGHNRIDAEAFAGVAGYRLGDDLETSFEYEYIYASGDTNSRDNKDERFQPPFTFGHKYHGIADQVGFTNSEDHNIKVKMKPMEDTQLTLAHHWFRRAERDDSWYNAGGAALRDGKGTIVTQPQDGHELGLSGSNDLGQEFDVIVNHKYSKNLTFELGYAHFFGGSFVKETHDTDDMDFLYLQTTIKF